MKKFITLLLGISIVATGFAQTKSEDAKDVILGRKKSGSTTNGGGSTNGSGNPRDVILGGSGNENSRTYPNYPSGSTRDQQVEQVNREYNAKIESIRNNPTLSSEEKARAIRQLNNDRERRIREINRKWDGRNRDRDRDRDDDDDDDDDDDKYKKDKKYKKGNNGNHYGWEKGKGNPHKNGGTPGKGNKSGKGKG